MKRTFSLAFSMLISICIQAQNQEPEYLEKEVFRNSDVVFLQIDDHTWLGSGNRITKLYPGNYQNNNIETLQWVKDLMRISIGTLSGEIKGEKATGEISGLDLFIDMYGVKVNYGYSGLK